LVVLDCTCGFGVCLSTVGSISTQEESIKVLLNVYPV
jgi:hypothetical protein